MGNTGDAGRLGNGEVELRIKGILNGYLGPLLCTAGEALRAVFGATGSGECRFDRRIESTLYDSQLGEILCMTGRLRSHTCRSGIKPWRYGLMGSGKRRTHCLFQSRWCEWCA